MFTGKVNALARRNPYYNDESSRIFDKDFGRCPSPFLLFPFSPLRPDRQDARSYFGGGCAALGASVSIHG
jgi:hypothetical protein